MTTLEEWQEEDRGSHAAPMDDLISLFPAGTLESRVAELLSKGYRKREIAKLLRKHPKTISRACRRIREEIEKQGEA